MTGNVTHRLLPPLTAARRATISVRKGANRMSSNSRRILVAGLCALLTSSVVAGTAVPVSGERRVAFNDGWRFFKGASDGAERPAFDDAKWQEVRLPHDWAIEGPFDSKLNPHTGALPISGTGWYRKTFTLPASLKGRYFTIEFDGAMSNARSG